MSYHYGAGNHKEMKNVLKKSLKMLAGTAVVLTVVAIALAGSISYIFVGYDKELLEMTTKAFRICSIPFLVMWFNMYASSFFTALNDGMVSAVISFMRALVLPILCIFTLPLMWQVNGVWMSLVVSEFVGVIVSLAFMIGKKKTYQY